MWVRSTVTICVRTCWHNAAGQIIFIQFIASKFKGMNLCAVPSHENWIADVLSGLASATSVRWAPIRHRERHMWWPCANCTDTPSTPIPLRRSNIQRKITNWTKRKKKNDQIGGAAGHFGCWCGPCARRCLGMYDYIYIFFFLSTTCDINEYSTRAWARH